MNIKKVALALAICIALNGLWLYDSQNREVAQTNALVQSRLLPVDAVTPEQYKRLEITNHLIDNSQYNVLEIDLNFDVKKPEFQVLRPYNRPGDAVRIVRLFDNLSNARRGNAFEGKPNDANGLTSPTLTVKIDHESPEIDSPWVMKVGGQSAYTKQYFALANDQPGIIFTISESAYNKLIDNPVRLIDLRLMDMPTEESKRSVQSITLENNHGKVVLEAQADAWTSRGDYNGTADLKAIQDFVDELERRRAMSTLELDDRLEFGEAVAKVSVFDGVSTHTLEIGGPHPMDESVRLAKRDKLQYYLTLPSDAHQSFQKPILHWVERSLVPFDAQDIGRIVIEGPVRRAVPGERGSRAAQELQMVKQPETNIWFLAGRPNRVLHHDKFIEFLKTLGNLRADGVVPFSGDKLEAANEIYFGPGDHRYLVEEVVADGSDTEPTSASFQVSRTSETKTATTFVRRGEKGSTGNDPIFRMELETASALRVTERDLLFPVLFNGIDKKVERLVFRGPEGEVDLARRRDVNDPGWDHPDMTRQYSDDIGNRIIGKFSFAVEGELPSVIGVAGEPKWSIEAFDKDGKKIEHLKVFQDDLVKDSLLLPLTAEDGTLLPIRRDQLDRLDILTRRAFETGTETGTGSPEEINDSSNKSNPFNVDNK